MFQWYPLGMVSVNDLLDAKLQAHWAAQIVAGFGQTLLDPRPDDSQSNVGWTEEVGALCGHPSPEGFRVGLRISDLTLLFFNVEDSCLASLGLEGKTLYEGITWIGDIYTKEGGAHPSPAFAIRDYEMPTHPVAEQEPFRLDNQDAFQELEHWYANTHGILHSLTQEWKEAGPVRCWPHYFDIASLVVFPETPDSGQNPTVGCGMSPGDATFSEPYFYVTVWPYPPKEQLPELSFGFWHTEGFIGAILTASDLIKEQPKDFQAQRVQQFFSEGTQASFHALGNFPTAT